MSAQRTVRRLITYALLFALVVTNRRRAQRTAGPPAGGGDRAGPGRRRRARALAGVRPDWRAARGPFVVGGLAAARRPGGAVRHRLGSLPGRRLPARPAHRRHQRAEHSVLADRRPGPASGGCPWPPVWCGLRSGPGTGGCAGHPGRIRQISPMSPRCSARCWGSCWASAAPSPALCHPPASAALRGAATEVSVGKPWSGVGAAVPGLGRRRNHYLVVGIGSTTAAEKGEPAGHAVRLGPVTALGLRHVYL